MTTDITELAQSLKSAAGKATPGEWHKGRQDTVTGIIKVYARTGITKLNCIARTDAHEVGFGISEREHRANAELIALANPTNILVLVEALERAQRLSNLTEAERQAYLSLISDRDYHIDELESRTVKLPHQTDFDDPLSAYEAIEKCKEAIRAAGIKVKE